MKDELVPNGNANRVINKINENQQSAVGLEIYSNQEMATLNIIYHHTAIYYYTCNKTHSSNPCPKLGSLAFNKPLIFPRKKLHNYSAINGTISAMTSGYEISLSLSPHCFVLGILINGFLFSCYEIFCDKV